MKPNPDTPLIPLSEFGAEPFDESQYTEADSDPK